jgi:hypothetical protein
MKIVTEYAVLTVQLNPPMITSISTFPSKPLFSFCPIIPKVTADNADGVLYSWYREDPLKDEYIRIDYEGEGEIFIPDTALTPELIDCRLKLFCTPYHNRVDSDISSHKKDVIFGRSAAHYIPGRVLPPQFRSKMIEIWGDSSRIRGPARDSASKDGLPGLSITDSDGIRIVTYNILAEPYATSEHSKKTLYRYLKDQAVLETEYRAQLILTELLSLDADIICLQECDHKVFDLYLNPFLTHRGYTGIYTNKSSSVAEGCAMFIKENKFVLLRRIDAPLKSVIKEDDRMLFSLSGLLSEKPVLFDILCDKLGTVCQLVVLYCKFSPQRVIIVANAHLFYHPGESNDVIN